MTANEKKEMMSELIPKMSKIAGEGSPGAMMGMMMNHCMRMMRWMPLVPLTIGLVLLGLGYFLSPEAVKVLWLIAAGLITVLGIAGLIFTTSIVHSHKNIAA